MRRVLLWMARNKWMRRTLPRLWFARRAVRKFMPGETAEDALTAAAAFRDRGTAVLFTRLGETLTGVDDGDRAAADYLALIREAETRGIDAEVSVKLTQLGMDIDVERTLAHLRRLADEAAPKTVWIDMEGSDYTESTIQLYERLKATHSNAGICLQAYLRRTAADVERLTPISPRVRLVKGAYAEPASVAYRKGKDVDESFFSLTKTMLDRVKEGVDFFVGLGTHDVRLIEQAAEYAQSIGLPKESFDVEMLYGIRADEQRRLADLGYGVRVLIAYGDAWYPWYMRRLAERPANVVFALRQLLP